MQFGHEFKNFGKYQVGQELGSGNYAQVYQAIDTEHHRKVALRILRKVAPDVLEAEQKGAQYHEMLSLNPNTSRYVPTFFDAGTIDGHFYVAMEFVEGAPPKPTGSLSTAVDLGIQLTEALDQFHHVDFEVDRKRVKAVVHGDLKPDHIRVTSTGIKFLDFGFVKALTLTRRNETCDFIN